MLIQEYRASKILFNFLKSQNIEKPFLIPANVCGIIPLVFNNAGISFDFVDIQEDNLCIDQEFILNNTDNYSGVLFVRTYGNDEDFDSFFKTIKNNKKDFLIIDDCCLCLPQMEITIKNIDLKLYSLGYTKQVDLGVGSFAFLNDSLIYKNFTTSYNPSDFERYELALKKSIKENTHFVCDNYNFLQNISYKIDKQVLKDKIQSSIKHKAQLNEIYRTQLPILIQMDERFQQWRFNILVDPALKNVILEELFRNKLFASSHYYPLSNVWSNKECNVSMHLSKSVINLFNDFYYTEEQAVETCKIINRIIK